jgi:hypothetical protein
VLVPVTVSPLGFPRFCLSRHNCNIHSFIHAPSVVLAVSRIAPTAREVITSTGDRIVASAAGIPPVIGDTSMHDGSAPMPVCHEFNRNWLSLAIAYSKDRKYDGLSSVPQNQDQKSRFQLFRYHIGAKVLAMTKSPLA